jgi:hypothetical protein
MDNIKFIQALKRVPETNLRLITLAREAVKDDGTLDVEKLTFNMAELQTAIKEAQAYAESTRKAVSCLVKLNRSSS